MTTVTDRRQAVFTDFRAARLAIGALRECDRANECDTLAFVLMPDHLHWLLTLRRAPLDAVVRRAKSLAARRINAWRETPGARLWQSGFHDHAVRREEDIVAIARYVVANPVRAGLVRSVRDYAHWDAAWF